MKKFFKTIAVIFVFLLVLGGAVGGYFIHRHNSMYIGRDKALEIALRDAGVAVSDLRDRDIDFDSGYGSAWYDVDFETVAMEYEYSLNAVTGEILYSYSEAEHY